MGPIQVPPSFWVDDDEATIPYRLPVSVADLSVARSTRALKTGAGLTDYRVDFDYDIAVSTRAVSDLSSEEHLVFEPKALSDAVLKLEFGEGELLTSLNHESTGSLPGIIGSLVSFASTIVGALAPSVMRTEAPPDVPTEKPPADRYAEAFEKEKARAEALPELISKLELAIDKAAGDLAVAETEEKRKEFASAIDVLNSAREALEEDLGAYREHYRLWLLTQYPDPETTSYVVALDRVHPVSGDAPPSDIDPSDVDAWPIGTRFDDAGFILGLHDPNRPATRAAENDERSVGLVIRRPRPVRFCVYGRDAATDDRMKLIETIPANVVDMHSAIVGIPLTHVLSSKVTMSAALSANGVPTKLEFASTSFFKELAQSLAAAPAQVKEGLEGAKAIGDAVESLRQAPTLRRIQDLENRKKLIEAEIAFGGASAGRNLREELERVQGELDLAKAKKELAGL